MEVAPLVTPVALVGSGYGGRPDYRVTDWLSIGAGVDIYTFWSAIGDGHAELKRLAGPELAAAGIPAGSVLETNGTDTAVGFNVGVLLTPLRSETT